MNCECSSPVPRRDHFGGIDCVDCGGRVGSLRRPRGRPPVADKRKPRVKMNGAEWAEVQRKAEAAGMTAAAWVRMRCGV